MNKILVVIKKYINRINNTKGIDKYFTFKQK